MRTYLVRYRSEIVANNERDASREHREKFEDQIGSLESGTVEVLDSSTEMEQLGRMADEIRDLQVEKDE